MSYPGNLSSLQHQLRTRYVAEAVASNASDVTVAPIQINEPVFETIVVMEVLVCLTVCQIPCSPTTRDSAMPWPPCPASLLRDICINTSTVPGCLDPYM